jgi:O-succinylbenzoic acid--CoA ligase
MGDFKKLNNSFYEILKSSDPRIFYNPQMIDFPKQAFISWLSHNNNFSKHFFFLSSGSSGKLKIFGLSSRALLTSSYYVNQHVEVNYKDVWNICIPTYHLGGFSIFVRSYLAGNRYEIFLDSKWDAIKWVKFIEDKKCTLSSLVPTQIYDLVTNNLRCPASLRAVFVGGSALSANIYLNARELGWRLLPSYGCSECSSQIATALYSSLDSKVQKKIPDLQLLPHWCIEPFKDSSFQWKIQGPSLFDVQLEWDANNNSWIDFQRDRLESYLLPDQLEVTQANSQSYIKFMDRKMNLIKIGSELTSLQRLQDILEEVLCESNLCLNSFCIINVPNDRLESTIGLVSEKGQNESDIQNIQSKFNKKVLGFEKIQRKFMIDRIPRTNLSKIAYPQLRNMLGLA